MKNLVERLNYFNEWRRGAKTEMPNTKQIGLDIDSAIIIINQYELTKRKLDDCMAKLKSMSGNEHING